MNTEDLVRTIVNPAPWSDARPRLLCSWSGPHRAVLTADGDVEVELRCNDAMGEVAWLPASRVDDPADSVNLNLDPWLNARFPYPATYVSARFEAEGYRCLVPVDPTSYRGAGSFHARSGTRAFWYDADVAEAWVELTGQRVGDVLVNLAYRAIGGDPSVIVTAVLMRKKP